MNRLCALAVLVLFLAPVGLTRAQPPLLTPAQRTAIIDSVGQIVTEHYVFPDVGKRMADFIRKQERNGAYREFVDLPSLTGQLTDDLRSISHDLHMGVRPLPPDRPAGAPSDSSRRAQELEEGRLDNFGFQKVEQLPGNIGYIKLNQFYPAEVGGATAVAAMNLIGNCDALIFDLRENGGGESSMVQLLLSYLFDSSQILNTFEIRGQERRDQFWSFAYVPGRRLVDIPVYVLTSAGTFSAAEEFVYDLQNLKRGTLVGETTGGGANPVQFYRLYSLGVQLSVAFGRAVNPVSGTNWEGTGVKPDIMCPAPAALDQAQALALQTLAGKANPHRRAVLEWQLESVNARLHPVALSAEELESCTGTYGPRVVRLENGILRYHREDQPERNLVPLGGYRFALEGVDYVRFEFVTDATGRVTEIVARYDNGTTDRNVRTQ